MKATEKPVERRSQWPFMSAPETELIELRTRNAVMAEALLKVAQKLESSEGSSLVVQQLREVAKWGTK